MVNIYFSYLKAFSFSLFLMPLAWLLAFLLNEYCCIFSQQFINLIGVFAMICEGAALYGLSEIRTWCENTAAERLNKKLYNLFISMGLFFAALAYLLKPCL